MFVKKSLLIVVIVLILGGAIWYKSNRESGILTIHTSFVSTGAEGLIKYTIEKLNLAEKHKLNLIIDELEPGETERRLLAKEIDVGSHSPLLLVKSNAGGKNIRMFAPLLTPPNSLLVKSDSPYYNLEDLKGLKIAVLPKLSAGFENMDLEFRILGFNLEEEFVLTFGGIPDAVKFLNNGDVEGAFLSEPLSSKFLASGQYREILNLRTFWLEKFDEPNIFVGRAAYADWIDVNPVAAKRLQEMYLEATLYVQQHPEFVREYAMEILKSETEEEIKLIVERLPYVFTTEWNQDTVNSAIFLIEKAAEFGFIDTVPDNVEELFIMY